MLPSAKVAVEAQALRDLVAWDDLSLDSLVALVRSLAGAPVLSAGLIKVRGGLAYLGGNFRGRSILASIHPRQEPRYHKRRGFYFRKERSSPVKCEQF